MKAVALVGLLCGFAVAAPTKTVDEKRQLGGFQLPSGIPDLSSLASILPIPSNLPNFGDLSSQKSSSSTGGFSLPTDLPDFSSILKGLGGSSRSSDSNPLGNLFSRDAPVKRGYGITESGVTDNKGCNPLTFIFARGTTELGNMGSVVGPPVADKISSLTGGKVTVQGVDYPADAAGNASLGSSGGPTMAKLVKQALQQCPNTKVVLGGYSQGSMVVHNAANSLSAGQVTAAVLFGDPFKAINVGKLSSDKVKEFCASGDPVCENGFNVLAHLSYGSDAQTAAQFLVQAAGVSSS